MIKLQKLKSLKQYFFLFVIVLGITKSNAQEPKDIGSTFNKSSKAFLAIPIINNTPVTKTGFGGLGMFFLSKKRG